MSQEQMLRKANETISKLDQQLAAARSRNKFLEQWREETLRVESQWDAQAVGRELGLPLGRSIRAGILPAIISLKKENAQLLEKIKKLEAKGG